MFLSRLVLNPRSREVRRDLSDAHELHRTVLRAFPDAADGGPGRVLYRLDADDPARPALLVQSHREPDWGDLPPGYVLGRPESKPFDPAFAAGRRLRFRLRANPTMKTCKPLVLASAKPRRVGLARECDQLGWLLRKAQAAGFEVAGLAGTVAANAAAEAEARAAGTPAETRACPGVVVVPEGGGRGRRGSATLTHLAVRFEGVLTVTDAALFAAALAGGVGSAKGYGFGLLSLAPAEGRP